MKKYLISLLFCVCVQPSCYANKVMVGVGGGGTWRGYCAGPTFGFGASSQKGCCDALKQESATGKRGVSEQDRIHCQAHWSGAKVPNKELSQHRMVGGDGTQTHCGTVSPAYQKQCCQELFQRHTNKEININDDNKVACLGALFERAAQKSEGLGDESRAKKIRLFDHLMKEAISQDTQSSHGKKHQRKGSHTHNMVASIDAQRG